MKRRHWAGRGQARAQDGHWAVAGRWEIDGRGSSVKPMWGVEMRVVKSVKQDKHHGTSAVECVSPHICIEASTLEAPASEDRICRK